MVILVGLAGLCVYEGKIESVIFDKGHGTLVLRRTSSACEQKQTYHVSSAHKADARPESASFDLNDLVGIAQRLHHIQQVYAARKGIKKANMDMTHFALIIRMANGQRIKVLETKNATKIRKELICVRKFLGHEDKELAIFDETRQKDGSKTENRYRGAPRESQMINSKGERIFEDENIEIVTPTATEIDS